ncbi:hypothetical protein P886_0976 [Alteromonadaceae bacterium 2753L.S.0a.02]|nr:hypothetical protein P886_0976 [Alteromonadaceae bacterium 2753L.S.0a.02]
MSDKFATMRSRFAFVCFLLAITSYGCTTNKQNKTSDREHENIAPFAENTLEMLGLEKVQVRDNELIYLRPYVDEKFLALDELQTNLALLGAIRDSAVDYSIELLSITEQYDNEIAQVAAYVANLENNLADAIISSGIVTGEEWQAIKQRIAAQTRLLGALREFQLIVNASGEYYEDLIEKIKAQNLQAVKEEFDRRIQRDFNAPLEYFTQIYQTRNAIYRAIAALEKYRTGDSASLVEYRKTAPPFFKRALSDSHPNDKTLQQYLDYVNRQLQSNNEQITAGQLDLKDYLNIRAELERKEKEIYQIMSLVRIQYLTWVRAHNALAEGVKDPSKWFQMGKAAAKLALSLM